MFSPSAGAAPRTDEEELRGPVQRAGGEEASVRGGEVQLGGSAENPRAAETGRLKVSNARAPLKISSEILHDSLCFSVVKPSCILVTVK